MKIKKFLSLAIAVVIVFAYTNVMVSAETNNVTATIGSETYVSFWDAVNEAADGATIELLDDVTYDLWNSIWNKKNLTINGNNHTLTVAAVDSGINGGGLLLKASNLTINDLTVALPATSTGEMERLATMYSGTLNNVTVTGGSFAVSVIGEGTVVIDNCDFSGINGWAIETEGRATSDAASLTISNSTFDENAVIIRGQNTTFTGNTIKDAGEGVNVLGEAVITGNDFGESTLGIDSGVEVTIENNAINAVEFTNWLGGENYSNVTVENNTLSDEALESFQTNVDENIVSVKPAPVEVSTYEELVAALEKDNANIIMKNDITGTANQNSGYGVAGIVLNAGDVLDGNSYKLTINGANGTWDCAVAMKGGTVKNLTVSGAFRGIFMPGANGDVVIDNCKIEDVIYTFNSDAGSTEYSVTIKNTTLNGWTSYSAVHGSVAFEDCTFGEGNGYAFCRPYQPTTFTGCEFNEGFEFDATKTADSTLVFDECTYDGEALNSENAAPMFYNGGTVVIDDASVVFEEYVPVAQIGDTKYTSLEEALATAQDGETVTLTWAEGDAPIAMNGAVYGKSVTITGTATVDWSQGYLFIGRGGAGNGTVIFDGANLTSASSTAAYGIHVSGREKDTDNKYDGTLEIKNSTIELDYLINRGTINVDNSTLTVKNGFGIAGRPASETESGEAATATINITNGSYVKVLNHNGMGIGVASATPEGKGILNLTDSTFECASFNIDADLGDFNVYGASTLKIDTLTGKEIDLHHNANIKDSTVGGEVMLYGKVTFSGDNTFAMLYDYGNAYSTDYAEWIVEKGASVTLTEKARYGLGYGDKGTVYGNLEDALTARENLTEDDISLFTHGLVAMSNWDVANSLTVKDAYVVIGSNNSFGNSASSSHKGTYDIDFENAVLDASRITFYAANSKTDFNFVDSDVKVGTFMTRDADSIFTLTNTKLLSTTTTNGTDEGNYHAGTLTLTKSDLTYSAPLVMENGTLTLDADSSLIAPEITGAGKISIDASEFDGTDVQVITADMSSYTGTIEVTGNEKAIYEITETGLIVKVIPELPTATVTELNADELGLTFALNFKADEVTDAQLAYYGDWYADFVLTVNKDVTFNANGNADGYLSGQYDAWSENWINVPFEDVTIKAGESLKIMEYAATLMGQAGLKVTYNDVYTGVQDFDCGVFFTEEFLAANPDLEVKLSLNMYNPEDETEVYAIGETYEFEVPSVEETLNTKSSYIRNIETTNANGEDRYQVILFAGIDSLNYSKVGYEVTVNGVTVSENTNIVYTSYVAAGETYQASAWGEDCEYIFALPINFPTTLGDKPATYRPYAIKLDGTTYIYGETVTIDKIYNK